MGRGAEEEDEDGDNDSKRSFGIEKKQATPPLDHSPLHPEAPDTGKDDSQLLYSTVDQSHIAMKRFSRV